MYTGLGLGYMIEHYTGIQGMTVVTEHTDEHELGFRLQGLIVVTKKTGENKLRFRFRKGTTVCKVITDGLHRIIIGIETTKVLRFR